MCDAHIHHYWVLLNGFLSFEQILKVEKVEKKIPNTVDWKKMSSSDPTDLSPMIHYSNPEEVMANLPRLPSKCYYMALTLDSEKDVRKTIEGVLPNLRKVKFFKYQICQCCSMLDKVYTMTTYYDYFFQSIQKLPRIMFWFVSQLSESFNPTIGKVLNMKSQQKRIFEL